MVNFFMAREQRGVAAVLFRSLSASANKIPTKRFATVRLVSVLRFPAASAVFHDGGVSDRERIR